MAEKEKKIMVSICCLTYNQEAYVRQALEGFVGQKTSFSYEILIHDDASTDRTAKIIREYALLYPDRVKPILQTENQYAKGLTNVSGTYNFPRAKGRYIAMCEGDDYWTDPYKLAPWCFTAHAFRLWDGLLQNRRCALIRRAGK